MRGGASVCMERGISARRRYAALRVARTGALDERGHGGGDHPVPFRTRQLSPPSPDVLRGKPVGGRAAALAQRARTRAPAHRRPRHARGPLLSRPAFLPARALESFILRFRRMDVRIFSRHTAVFLVVFRTLPSRAGKLSHCM